MKTIVTGILLFFSILLYGQQDPAAKSILDKFSGAALTSPAVTMSFIMKIHDRVEQSASESEGTVVIMDSMYKLTIPDNTIWFNGSANWTLTPEVKEVTVTLPDPDDNTFLTSPSSVFTMYRKDFKYRLVEEREEGSIIDLYPEEPAETDFSRIRLVIKNEKLISAEYRRKDGIDMYIDITGYRLDKSYKSEYFTFSRDDHPGVDIIDMR
ncbi:MAG TPA: outer membrane lipoprotein carrier protein LolA [Bacteroidales bacterium]|nr:outer membrane lipoprotein carrier protein LolA [Bacteroidales bacterium]